MSAEFPTFNASVLGAPGSVLIDDLDTALLVGRTFVFGDPEEIIVARSNDEVVNALSRLEECLTEGLYAAGYLTYEAGSVLDKPIVSKNPSAIPLVWLGVYRGCREFDYGDLDLGGEGLVDDVSNARLNVTDDEYMRCVRRVIDYIAAGDVYQVNYTSKLLFDNAGTAAGLFARLRKAHPVCHSAFINAGEFQVVSLSPELFLRRTGRKLVTRPMKGTYRRGRCCEEDARYAGFLKHDEKNRAENVMIADLMRNDIGRISEHGGIRVSELFQIERYRSVLQMTSTVEGILRAGVSTPEILKATFPPGSVTGAPKIRSMEIIDELERGARGVYCGSIGFFRPDGDFILNVAIRTIVQRGTLCEMGIGGGIVADSSPRDELREALLKGSFLKAEAVKFHLLETMLYRPRDGYFLLEEHLQRMKQSADYFGWGFPEVSARTALRSAASEIESSPDISGARVRLLVSKAGKASVEWTAIDARGGDPVRLLLASRRTDSNDLFLYHKTTHRQAYDSDLRKAREAGYFDVLYLNENGELTECSTTNLALEIGGQWYTPSLSSGLLPGIWREKRLTEGTVLERALTLDDLQRAARVLIGNSVRDGVEVGGIEDGRRTIWPAPLCATSL